MHFRDQYLARADMWRMTNSELCGKTVYTGQKITFLSTIRATVKSIYIKGSKVSTACFTSNTKPVFRSESARYVLFIQMSQEMWDFDESSGYIMFTKVVNGFLPELFKRWVELNVRHLVSIILFTRIIYEPAVAISEGSVSFTACPQLPSTDAPTYRDFYRVVVSEMASGEWTAIIHQLKIEFKAFLKNILVMKKSFPDRSVAEEAGTGKSGEDFRDSAPCEDDVAQKTSFANMAPDIAPFGEWPLETTARVTDSSPDLVSVSSTIENRASERSPVQVYDPVTPALNKSTAEESATENSIPEESASKSSAECKNASNRPAVDSNCEEPGPAPLQTDTLPTPDGPLGRGTRHGEVYHDIKGRPTDAVRGNILEAINLASSQFSTDYIDRDLVRTGLSIAVVTPGTGVFEVDHGLLKLTSSNLVENGIGIDLVCLARMPLHSVPLFKFHDINAVDGDERPFARNAADGSIKYNSPASGAPRLGGDWNFAMPHWIDASYWRGSPGDPTSDSDTSDSNYDKVRSGHQGSGDFRLRCRLHELQMSDAVGNDKNSVDLPFLQQGTLRANTGDQWSSPRSRKVTSVSLVPPLNRSMKAVARGPPSKDTVRGSNLKATPALRSGPSRPSWMDEYDKNTFQLCRETYPHSGLRNQQPPKDADVVSANHWPLETSHSVMKLETHDTQTSTSAPDSRHEPFNSRETRGTRLTGMRTPQRTPTSALRHISFGKLGIGTAKSTPSVGLSPEVVDSPAAGIAIASFPRRKGQTAVSKQVRQSLARMPTTQNSTLMASERANDEGTAERVSSEPVRSAISAITAEASLEVHPVAQASIAGELQSNDEIDASTAMPQSNPPEPNSNLKNGNTGHRFAERIADSSVAPSWLTLVNPSNPRKYDAPMARKFGRWQHVFPRPPRSSRLKWKSLCSPAAIPLTTEHSSVTEQMLGGYKRDTYEVVQNQREELEEDPKTQEPLIKELIAMRLSHGFQLVVGGTGSDRASGTHQDYLSTEGAEVHMTAGTAVHRLRHIGLGHVEVVLYTSEPTATETPLRSEILRQEYTPYTRTMLGQDYRPLNMDLKTVTNKYNWNYIDNFVAGYHEEFSEILRFWRARFVLIPVELSSGRRPLRLLNEDSEEEIRLEGIRKLTQYLGQRKYTSPGERQKFPGPVRLPKDPNPLAIEYQTRDPSAVVAAGLEKSQLVETDTSSLLPQPFADVEHFNSSSIDIHRLAQEIQGEKGVKLMDRRWHLKLYYNCFLGEDLTTWLLQSFEDIETRDDAVELGNKLMAHGLFVHVQKKHRFRDGNFFYQIASEYRISRSDSSWFGRKRSERSAPASPVSESSRNSPLPVRTRSRSNTGNSSGDAAEKTPIKTGGHTKPRILLSSVMRYNLDLRKRSYRPEIVNLHYDRLCNPENAYHLRIEWLNVTAKLIEDAIVTWASLVDRYGLKLVEVPIAEASAICEVHRFRAPYRISLVLPPPERHSPQYSDTTSFAPQPHTDKHVYQKALLKKLGFVLDFESASSFPPDVSVSYSWGKPDYRYTQFIHKSGSLVAQITEEGDFLLLANRLCSDRAAAVKDTSKFKESDTSGGTGRQTNPNTPMSSPLVRAVPEPTFSNVGHGHDQNEARSKTPEQIKDEVEMFCHDERALRQFYDDMLRRPNLQTPQSTPQSTPLLNASIPALSLPVSGMRRDISPAPPLGVALKDERVDAKDWTSSREKKTE